MTRRTWFRTITGAFATLVTGLGLRKVEKKSVPNPDYVDATPKVYVRHWRELYARAYYDGERFHFEDVKPEEE